MAASSADRSPSLAARSSRVSSSISADDTWEPLGPKSRPGDPIATMPSVRFANNFFLVLTLLADAAVVLGIMGALAAAASRRAREVVRGAVEVVGPWSIAIAFVVAAVTTAGSLYYSESAGFTPCELCWYQRIVMYPLVVVLLV